MAIAGLFEERAISRQPPSSRSGRKFLIEHLKFFPSASLAIRMREKVDQEANCNMIGMFLAYQCFAGL